MFREKNLFNINFIMEKKNNVIHTRVYHTRVEYENFLSLFNKILFHFYFSISNIVFSNKGFHQSQYFHTLLHFEHRCRHRELSRKTRAIGWLSDYAKLFRRYTLCIVYFQLLFNALLFVPIESGFCAYSVCLFF